jgi:superfamily I DNA/RNA helicase
LNLERRGRPSLKRGQRSAIWEIHQALERQRDRDIEWNEVPAMALAEVERAKSFVPYKAAVLDEGQDFGPVMIRLARALVGGDDRRLMVLADPSQSIYPSGFYWAQRELTVKGGEVRWLTKGYRTTERIHELAASVVEQRDDGPPVDFSSRAGPLPVLWVEPDRQAMVEALAASIEQDLTADSGWLPEHIAVIAPTWQSLAETTTALQRRAIPFRPPLRDDKEVKLDDGRVKLLTIHSAKGLEFPVVYMFVTTSGFRKMESNERFLFHVGLTRSSFRMCVLTCLEECHGVLYELEPQLYELQGSAAPSFEAERTMRGLGP